MTPEEFVVLGERADMLAWELECLRAQLDDVYERLAETLDALIAETERRIAAASN